MADLTNKRRLAAELLGVGESRVRLDPEATEQLQDAITRESIRGWLSAGLIWTVPKKGISRGRVRLRRIKGKRRGKGQVQEGSKGFPCGQEDYLGYKSQDAKANTQGEKGSRRHYKSGFQVLVFAG